VYLQKLSNSKTYDEQLLLHYQTDLLGHQPCVAATWRVDSYDERERVPGGEGATADGGGGTGHGHLRVSQKIASEVIIHGGSATTNSRTSFT